MAMISFNGESERTSWKFVYATGSRTLAYGANIEEDGSRIWLSFDQSWVWAPRGKATVWFRPHRESDGILVRFESYEQRAEFLQELDTALCFKDD